MPTLKELQKNADECLRLARESNELRTKLALIEIGTELRVVAQHFEGDVRRRLPSYPRRLRLPAEVILRLRSEKSRNEDTALPRPPAGHSASL
jgi:hypothetical protein